MRVIGGNARGRRLKVPKGQTLRPTAARVKEALFNILPHDLSGAKALDLFAGTGNLTIEALSRGATAAILVDASAESGKAIRENVRRLDLTDRTKVLIMPVARALRLLMGQGETFDLIFLDPPYERQWIEDFEDHCAEQRGDLSRLIRSDNQRTRRSRKAHASRLRSGHYRHRDQSGQRLFSFQSGRASADGAGSFQRL